MGAGVFLEPASVVFLLVTGCWVNRRVNNSAVSFESTEWTKRLEKDEESIDTTILDAASIPVPPSPRGFGDDKPSRTRELRLWRWQTTMTSPDTRVFQDRWFSKVIQKFPFLVEVWYWALIYWVYQIARGISAITLSEETVHIARAHALQVIELEKRLHIFFEIPIQRFFLKYPFLMLWTNRVYSFIHIPGTILFLIILFWYTTTRTTSAPANMAGEQRVSEPAASNNTQNTLLYQARRRTMALCNLLAFIVFTLWPCMPPRLLSDPTVEGPIGKQSREYGFIDTVHGDNGEASVWTQNKFCNQYAAMPSLHFGYSALIGLTIATIPLSHNGPGQRRKSLFGKKVNFRGSTFHINYPSGKRIACVVLGLAYPLVILVAIIATANHFVLDAVAGAMICALAWSRNRVLLNLLPLQDNFLAMLQVHFPETEGEDVVERDGIGAWGNDEEGILGKI